MSEKKVVLGEALYEELQHNDYLEKLSEILNNQYFKCLNGEPYLLTKKQISHLLRFADLLSKSFNKQGSINQKVRAREIVDKMLKLYPSLPVIRYVANSVYKQGGYNQRGITYAPDFVVFGTDGAIEHVYDVKTGINQRAVDTAAKIRFTLFSLKTGLPVEVVVPRVHDFKMKLFGFTNSQIQTAHAHYDRKGNIKRCKNGEPVYDHYDVYHSIDYELKDIIGN